MSDDISTAAGTLVSCSGQQESKDAGSSGPRRRRGRPPKGAAAGDGARQALVASALDLFARKGFAGTSLAEVAKVAGSTPSLVHYYFQSKDELWKASLNSVLAELRGEFNRLELALADESSLFGLEQVVRGFVAFSSQHPEVSLILRNERGEVGPRVEWLWSEHWAPLRALPLRLISQAQAEGALRQGDPNHLLQIIIGACLHPLRGRLSLHKIYGVAPDSNEVFEIHADLMIATLFDGLRADEPIVPVLACKPGATSQQE